MAGIAIFLFFGSEKVSGGYDAILQPLMLWVIGLTAGWIYIIYGMLRWEAFPEKLIKFFARDTYGIYVIHGFVLPVITRMNIETSSPFLLMVVLFVPTFLVSWGIVRVIRFILPPKFSGYLL